MRVWHLVNSLEVGGAETMVATLCLRQREMGLEPSVHCLIRRGTLADDLTSRGIPVLLHGPAPLVRSVRNMLRAARETGRPDVLHCHNEGPAIVGALLRTAARVRKAVVTRHGLVPPGQNRQRELKFWLASRRIDAVVAVCEAAHRNLARGPLSSPGKIVTIYNCAAPAERSAARAPGAARGRFTVINVARHADEKDIGCLLRGFAEARREAADARLDLVGSGPLTPELERLATALGIAGHVRFLGERRDVGDLLADAQLFVLSSYSEGLPIALLEAMAAGVPQVVTQVGGMPEIVEMSGGGAVIPARDPAALALAILQFHRDEAMRRKCGERSRECYYRRFTPEKMAADYAALYDR